MNIKSLSYWNESYLRLRAAVCGARTFCNDEFRIHWHSSLYIPCAHTTSHSPHRCPHYFSPSFSSFSSTTISSFCYHYYSSSFASSCDTRVCMYTYIHTYIYILFHSGIYNNRAVSHRVLFNGRRLHGTRPALCTTYIVFKPVSMCLFFFLLYLYCFYISLSLFLSISISVLYLLLPNFFVS